VGNASGGFHTRARTALAVLQYRIRHRLSNEVDVVSRPGRTLSLANLDGCDDGRNGKPVQQNAGPVIP